MGVASVLVPRDETRERHDPIDLGATWRGMNNPFIRRVTIRNYKSIAACRVELGALMFLVGPNGSGKSNFLDALRFVADSLRISLDYALRDRGSIREVRRRSGGHPTHFSLRLDFVLPSGQTGHYAFRVGAKPNGGFEVQTEECRIGAFLPHRDASFHVEGGRVTEASFQPHPAVLPDRLFLVAASGIPEFRPVFDALSRIEVYNLNPRAIASMQKPDPGEILRRDGGNAASVLQRFSPDMHQAVETDLARIVPGISEIKYRTLGSQETIEFRQIVQSQEHSWRFLADSMSDGTLRALGVLLAVYQASTASSDQPRPLTVGLEEPESALHPAAARVLLGALREGSRHCQVLVTSHSPDLLDDPDIPTDALLSVDNQKGLTRIGPIDDAGKEMMKRKLFTAGELLRQSQLAPAESVLSDVRDERQLNIFEANGLP
ncbi:MAG TPA: AAA family ATPase [Rhodopila sp.]|jgi:predicted ATPase